MKTTSQPATCGVCLWLAILPCKSLALALLMIAVLTAERGGGATARAGDSEPTLLREATEVTPADATAMGAVCRARLAGAIERSLALLERAAAGSAEQRKCFTCHSQAHPVLVLSEARRRGFAIDAENLDRQLLHTAKHLQRGRSDYVEGRGQGGKADTAGYALWTLQAAGYQSAETTDPVVVWLLQQQQPSGRWRRSGERPPSEASDFTTTYVALQGIKHFADERQQTEVAAKFELARQWLIANAAADTEDRVFRLLALQLVAAPEEALQAAADDLLAAQREDGGWAQLDSLASDAYATGSVLFALHQSKRLSAAEVAFQKGAAFLLDSQLADGSWHVVTRSVPFQTYYETGFPHGKDQFISTSATAWASLALLAAYPGDAPQTPSDAIDSEVADPPPTDAPDD